MNEQLGEPLAKRREEVGIKIDWKPLLRTPFTCSIVVPGASERGSEASISQSRRPREVSGNAAGRPRSSFASGSECMGAD
jgi:hypothetical protein